jgi:hypothetical protein
MAGLQVALGVNYGLVLLLIVLARYLARGDIRNSEAYEVADHLDLGENA